MKKVLLVLLSLLSTQQTAIIMLLVCIIPIAALILLAIILRVKNAIKKNKNRTEDVSDESANSNEQLQVFVTALGGEENYLSSTIERNKISFKVKDTSLVDGEKLKELGATGVLIIGDEVRASFGDRSASVWEIVKK